MNRIVIASCLIISLLSCNAQPQSKIITLISQVDDNGELYGKTDTASVEYISSEGIVIKKVAYTSRGTRTKFYNSQGKLMTQVSEYGKGFIIHVESIRDIHGYMISSKSYDSKSADTTWVDYRNTFNSDSSILLSDAINRDEKVVSERYRMRFDQNRNIIEDTELDSLSNEVTKNEYEYSKGNKLVKQSYYEKGLLISSTEYTYDGNKKKEAILTPTAKDRRKIKSWFIYQ